jgi:hypothetical protein
MLLRVHPAAALATALMSTSLATYAFGLANLLWLAVPAVAGTTLIIFMFLSFRSPQEMVAASKVFLSSTATTLFTCYAIATYLLSRPMLFVFWDEYSHWGLVVKAMFTFDALSPYSPAYLIFPSYPPSAATFEYFIAKFSQTWNEADSIWAYQLIFGSLFVTFGRALTWRRWPRILIFGAVFLLTSVLFFDSFLGIIIEPLLAATFGYALALIWIERGWTQSFFIRLGVALSFLALLKDSGVFLAIICLIFLGFFYRVSGKRLNFRDKQTWSLLSVFIAVGLAYLSWSITLRITNTHLMFSQPISLSSVWQLLTGTGSEFYRQVTARFNDALFSMHLNSIDSGIPFSWAIWLVILIPTTIYLATLHERLSKSWRLLGPALILLSGALAYQFGLLVLYVTRFDKGEALGLASFSRYLSTYVFGLVLFVAFVFIAQMADQGFTVKRGAKRKPAWSFISVSTVFLMGVAFFAPFSVFLNHWPGGAAARAEFREPYASLEAQAKQAGLTKNDVVLSIAQHTSGLEHLMTMYQLMPANVLDRPYSVGPRRDETDTLTDDSIDEVSIQTLLRSVNYVALVVIDEQFKSDFRAIFEDPEDIQPAKLFEVNCGPTGCKLKGTS